MLKTKEIENTTCCAVCVSQSVSHIHVQNSFWVCIIYLSRLFWQGGNTPRALASANNNTETVNAMDAVHSQHCMRHAHRVAYVTHTHSRCHFANKSPLCDKHHWNPRPYILGNETCYIGHSNQTNENHAWSWWFNRTSLFQLWDTQGRFDQFLLVLLCLEHALD